MSIDLFASTLKNSFTRNDLPYLEDNNYIRVIGPATLHVEILKTFHYIDEKRHIDTTCIRNTSGYL